MEFGDLHQDKPVQDKIVNFHNSVEKIEGILEVALKEDVYEKLTTKEKVDYDLFMTFTLNTLYWLYLRAKGQDPNKNEIKSQLSRVKEYMLKAKQAHERNTIRPKLNQEVAGRFIKHGIHHRDDVTEKPPNKKIKFSD